MASTDFTLSNPPPEGHEDVGKFAYDLFLASQQEKQRLGCLEKWFECHRLYLGDVWNKSRTFTTTDRHKVSVNLIFANIERTVATLTSEDPVAELHSSDGILDDTDALFSQKVRDWWSATEQGTLLATSTRGMEIYGSTAEKHVPNRKKNCPDVVLTDLFGFFPAPGNYQSVQDMPYLAFADALDCHWVESNFGRARGEVKADDVYSTLGEDREKNIPIPQAAREAAVNVGGHYVMSSPVRGAMRADRALVIELWMKDPTSIGTDELGDPILKYPGGIRVITITNRGKLVLADRANPNINPALPVEVAKKTYGWSNYPCSFAVSYKDTFSFWGFSAADQVGDLQLKIDEVLSRIKSYIDLCCLPPLIIPKDSGIIIRGPGGDLKVTNRAGLILKPDTGSVGAGIRYLQVPNLPSDFFKVLDLYLMFFDRVHAIQDINRGEKPGEVRSGYGINLLQQRNDAVMGHKTKAMDYLVRERGRWAISYYQNFGWREETVTVNDEQKTFRGVDYAERQFNYVVESGSTLIKSDAQIQQESMELFKAGAIDTQALLERANYPGWKTILQRMSGDKLKIAMQTLVDAGVPEEIVQQLTQYVKQAPENNKEQADMPAGVKGSSNPARETDQNLMRQ